MIVHRSKEPKQHNHVARESRRQAGLTPRRVLLEEITLADLDDLELFDGSTLPMPLTTGACHSFGATVSPPAPGTRSSQAKPVNSTVLDGLGAQRRVHWGNPANARLVHA